MARPATYDRLRKKQPLELRIPVYLEQEPIERLDKLRDDLGAARTADRTAARTADRTVKAAAANDVGPSEDVVRLEADIAAAEEAVSESTLTMVFRQIGRKRYDALIDAHPVSDEQKAEATKAGKELPPYNMETFAPALISASCAEPAMTPDEVQELFDEWSTGEINDMFTAALAVNTGRRTVVLGKG